MAKKSDNMSLKQLEKLYKSAVPANKQGTPPKAAAAIKKTAAAKVKSLAKKAGGKAMGSAGMVMDIANMTAAAREKSKRKMRSQAMGLPDA